MIELVNCQACNPKWYIWQGQEEFKGKGIVGATFLKFQLGFVVYLRDDLEATLVTPFYSLVQRAILFCIHLFVLVLSEY